MATRTLLIHMGTPETWWCDVCQTSGGFTVHGYTLNTTGVRRVITIRRCLTCNPR